MELANTIGGVLGIIVFLIIVFAIFSKKINHQENSRVLDKWMEEKRAKEKERFKSIHNFKFSVSDHLSDETHKIDSGAKSEILAKNEGKTVKQVYIGLPETLKDRIFWVGEKFRTNPLSFTPGGMDVVVEYCSNVVLGYDRVKYPGKYIRKFFLGAIKITDEVFDSYDRDKQFSLVKSQINRIFARKWKNLQEKENTPFKEVWNSFENELPWDKLESLKF